MAFKYLPFLAILFLRCVSAAAQGTGTIPEFAKQAQDTVVYNSVEVPPQFPGGVTQFYAYVQNNFKIPMRFKGKRKIITQFVVEKDGKISRINILKGGEEGVGDEVKRLLESSPLWKAGEQNGTPVRVLYSLLIPIENN